MLFASGEYDVDNPNGLEDVKDCMEERLNRNENVSISNIDMEKVKTYSKQWTFDFGRHKGEMIGSLNVSLEYLLWCLDHVSFFSVDYRFLNFLVHKNPTILRHASIEVAIYKNELAEINEECNYEQAMDNLGEYQWREELRNEEIDLIGGGEYDSDDFDGDWDKLYTDKGLD